MAGIALPGAEPRDISRWRLASASARVRADRLAGVSAEPMKSGVDRARVKGLKDREDARFADEHPRSARADRPRPLRRCPTASPWRGTSAATTTCRRGSPRAAARASSTWTATRTATSTSRTCPCSAGMRRSRWCAPSTSTSPAATSSSSRPRTRSSSPRSWAAGSASRSGSTRCSATHANTEAIRVARVVTGRDNVLLFDGKYHGHLDEALVELDADGRLVPEERGVPADVVGGTVLVPFNDSGALARALERRDVALVLTEPAITNNFGLLLPDAGFHEALRRLTRETGTLLAYRRDAHAGRRARRAHGAWGLEPDLVTSGKSIAGGLPFGAWGMTDEIAEVLDAGEGPGRRAVEPGRDRRHDLRQRALDGRGARDDDRDPHARGVRAHAAPGRAAGRWDAGRRRPHAGCRGTSTTWARAPATRSGRRRSATPPRPARAADELLTRLIRIWLANRGVWEAIVGAGPVCSGARDRRGRGCLPGRLGVAARRAHGLRWRDG